MRGDFKTGLDYFKSVLNEAKEAGDRNREGRAYILLASSYLSLGEVTKAIELFRSSLYWKRNWKQRFANGCI